MTRILLVEDDPLIADFIDRGLRAGGFTTVFSPDAERAMQLVRDGEAIDLIVLDLGLPGADGFSVLHSLRSTGRETPVLVLTARAELREASLAAGADEFMSKPFRFANLLARIRALLPAEQL
jgi:DNA-binding response OmpR family regulator